MQAWEQFTKETRPDLPGSRKSAEIIFVEMRAQCRRWRGVSDRPPATQAWELLAVQPGRLEDHGICNERCGRLGMCLYTHWCDEMGGDVDTADHLWPDLPPGFTAYCLESREIVAVKRLLVVARAVQLLP